MNKTIESFIREQIVATCGNDYRNVHFRRSGVGCINETWQAFGEGLSSLFIKVGRSDAADMYEREREGLVLLSQARKLRIPQAYTVAANEHCACLIMEFIQLQPLRLAAQVALGEALAELHSISTDQYGLAEDNYIGRSRQVNGFAEDWWEFYCDKRLTVQWEMAKRNGMRSELLQRLQRLIERVPAHFAYHKPRASLLHGDLWSGNVAADTAGTPVIYDPAVYYGDAETDIAMSQMFQSLGAGVYETYYQYLPAQSGHARRRSLYDLYHWLNHFNLFGVTYLGQVERAADTVLQEIEST